MSPQTRPQLTYVLAPAMRGPVEVTLRELLISYGRSVEADLLEGVLEIGRTLEAFGLIAEPPLGASGLDAVCVIRPLGQSAALGLALAAIQAGEGARVEFKSTLLLSVQHWERQPQPLLADCRSDKVIKSALKTVAAFLNSAGGTLLVGIRDSGACYGLQEDMKLADPAKADFDGWELELRRLIEKHFLARSANSYVSIDKIELDGKIAARVEVGSRQELTFVKFSGPEELYIRSGNRSIPVPFSDVEQYFSLEKKYA